MRRSVRSTYVLAQAGVAGDVAHQGAPVVVGERRALHEGGGVAVDRERLDLVEQRAQRLRLQLVVELAVVVGGGGVGRQVEDRRQVVAAGEAERLELEHHRHQHQAAQVEAVRLLQVARQRGGAGGAVALADQEGRAAPAGVAGNVEADEVADRGDVGLEPVELLGLLADHGAAVAGRDRIDEHQIADVEERVVVVDQLVGGRQREALVVEPHPLRPEQAEVHPDRRGAGAAVEREGERPRRGVVDPVEGVGDEEDLRLGDHPSASPCLSPFFSLSWRKTRVPQVTV